MSRNFWAAKNISGENACAKTVKPGRFWYHVVVQAVHVCAVISDCRLSPTYFSKFLPTRVLVESCFGTQVSCLKMSFWSWAWWCLTCNPSTWEDRAARSLSLRPASATWWTQGQPALYSKTLSQEKQNKTLSLIIRKLDGRGFEMGRKGTKVTGRKEREDKGIENDRDVICMMNSAKHSKKQEKLNSILQTSTKVIFGLRV